MLRDRYTPVDLFGLVPALMLRFEPEVAALDRLLDRVTELARSLSVTRGRKLRIDSTVVETTMHYPSDSGLLADGVRVPCASSCASRPPGVGLPVGR